jgi:hypothetical protein
MFNPFGNSNICAAASCGNMNSNIRPKPPRQGNVAQSFIADSIAYAAPTEDRLKPNRCHQIMRAGADLVLKASQYQKRLLGAQRLWRLLLIGYAHALVFGDDRAAATNVAARSSSAVRDYRRQ